MEGILIHFCSLNYQNIAKYQGEWKKDGGEIRFEIMIFKEKFSESLIVLHLVLIT